MAWATAAGVGLEEGEESDFRAPGPLTFLLEPADGSDTTSESGRFAEVEPAVLDVADAEEPVLLVDGSATASVAGFVTLEGAALDVTVPGERGLLEDASATLSAVADFAGSDEPVFAAPISLEWLFVADEGSVRATADAFLVDSGGADGRDFVSPEWFFSVEEPLVAEIEADEATGAEAAGLADFVSPMWVFLDVSPVAIEGADLVAVISPDLEFAGVASVVAVFFADVVGVA